MSSFPEAKIKTFIREEGLREENGKPRVEPDRAIRVIFMVKEGVSPDAPPLWSREFADGENTEETVDVDGLVSRIRLKVDNEVGSSSVPVVFRLMIIHGTSSAISPSLVSAQMPFTVHPIRKIGPNASSGNGSPYAQSFEDATEQGLSALMMRGMRMTQEIYFPEIQNLIAEKNQTIEDLRDELRAANSTIADMRTRLDEAEDKSLDRVIRLRDSALKQRLKERGGRLVINALTLLASQWMSPGGGNGGGDGGGGKSITGQNPPRMGRGAGAAIGGTASEDNKQQAEQASGAEGAEGEAATSSSSSSEPAAAAATPESKRERPAPSQRSVQGIPPPPPGFEHDDVVWVAANLARMNKPWDIAPVFGALVSEILPVISTLQSVVSPDQQALLFQAFTGYQQSGKVDMLVLQRFAEDLGEDGDLTRLHKLIQKLPTQRAQMALATVFHALRTNYDNEKSEDRELEKDLQRRVDEVRKGEVIDAEPEVPDDPVEEIKVKKPRIVSKEAAAEDRRKKSGRGVVVRESTPKKGTERDKPL